MKQWKTLWEKYRGILLYLFFGVITTLVNLAVYYLCYDLWGLGSDVSVVIAWVLSVLAAFITNKAFVFESRDWSRRVLFPEAGSFFGCRLGSGVLELILMHLTVEVWALPGMLMKLLVNILVVILNYIASKLVVFRNKKGM